MRRIFTLLIIAFPLIIIAFPLIARSQPEASDLVWLGINGSDSYNINTGNFQTYQGVRQFGMFQDASTQGWTAGIILDVPIDNNLCLSARAYHYNASVQFTTSRSDVPYMLLADSTIRGATFRDRLDVSLSYLSFDLLGKFIFGKVYTAIGPSIGIPERAAYVQSQSIVQPADIVFKSGGNTRQISADNFNKLGTTQSDASIRFAVSTLIGVDIPFGDRYMLSPELSYSLPFSKVLSSFDWELNALRLGIGLKMAFISPLPSTHEKFLPGDVVQHAASPVRQPDPRPILTLDAKSVMADGVQLNDAAIVVSEERSSAVIPVLPYVFFDENSAAIPDRYISRTNDFTEAKLTDSVLDVYHELLNILGERMRKFPETTILVTGTRESLDDKLVQNVAAARAESVKTYLVKNWGIAESRIETKQRSLPSLPSGRNTPSGREENRRAEITSNDAQLIAPVKIRLIKRVITPAAIRFSPNLQFATGVTSYQLHVQDSFGNTVFSASDNQAPPTEVNWQLDQNAFVNPSTQRYVSAEITVKTNSEEVHVTRHIPVRRVLRSRRESGEIVVDSMIERFNPMLFDFCSPKVSEYNRQVVDLFQSSVRTNSSVRLFGNTDVIGNPEYNKQLSLARATAAMELIQARVIPARVTAVGVRDAAALSNSLPEGRFYNRSVLIEVASPADSDEY